MNDRSCVETQSWLQQELRSQHAAPPADVIAHVAACARCRGALALLAIKALGLTAAPQPISCDRCQDEMAAFIDHAGDEGLAAAAGRRPAVWWHIWTCADCGEVYVMAERALRAARQGLIPPLTLEPQPARRPAHRPLTRIPRYLLRIALPERLGAAGVLRGGESGELVLDTDVAVDLEYTISARPSGAGQWQLSAAVSPPPLGWLEISFGEMRFRARFDARGIAVVPTVPDMLLSSHSGPDLEVGIEVD